MTITSSLSFEYVPGRTLADLIWTRREQQTPIQIEEAIQILCQVLDALAHRHQHDIVHRDIKPSNILVQSCANGTSKAKLMDFGIAFFDSADENLARLTDLSNGGPGTPLYMAPERFDSSTYDINGPGTDIYSVGVVLFELLEGLPPFRGSITEIITGHLEEKPQFRQRLAGVPKELQELTYKALAKDIHGRFLSAKEFRSELATFRKKDVTDNNQTPRGTPPQTMLYTPMPAQPRTFAQRRDTDTQTDNKKQVRRQFFRYGLPMILLGFLVSLPKPIEEPNVITSGKEFQQNVLTTPQAETERSDITLKSDTGLPQEITVIKENKNRTRLQSESEHYQNSIVEKATEKQSNTTPGTVTPTIIPEKNSALIEFIKNRQYESYSSSTPNTSDPKQGIK